MVNHMPQRKLLALGLSLLAMGATGCSEPMTGLGGGGKAPVSVTLLVNEDASDVAAGEAADAGPAVVEGYGTLRGRIVVEGGVPELSPVLAKGAPTKDAICSENAVPNESVQGTNGGLANVFIFLKRAPNVEVPPPPSEPVVLDQKGCKFVPHAFLVRVGQPIKIINSDPVAHNVRITAVSLSANNILQGNDTNGIEVTYERAERLPVRSQCDIHAWMEGWHLAVDHPWCALTAEDGTFEIPDVPAGEMEFVVWHERLGYIERSLTVEIPKDGEVEKTLTVESGKLASN